MTLNRQNPSRRAMLGYGAAALTAAMVRSPLARASAKELRILNSNVAWSDALGGAAAKAYQQLANVGVGADSQPYDGHYSKMLVELSQGSDTYDLVTSDDLWIRQPIHNKWAACLDDVKAKNPSLPAVEYGNLAPEALSYTMDGGRHYGLPVAMSTLAFVYRKDLFEKAGITKVPSNWTEYLEAAKTLHTSECAGNVLLIGGQDSLASGDFFARLMGLTKLSPTDDGFLNENNEPIFNSHGQGEKAIEMLRELKKYSPRGSEAFDYPEGSSALQQGKAAMMVSWSDVIVGVEQGPFKGKFGYTVPPTDEFHQDAIGGWSIFANAKSANLDEAYKFLAWMSKGPAYQMFREGGESSLCLKADIDNPEVLRAVPMLQALKDFGPKGVTPISIPFFRLTNAVEAQRIVFEEIQAAVLDQKPAKQAMQEAESRLRTLLHG